MSAPVTGLALDWLARYEALSARDRNYRSAMYADLFARCVAAVPAALTAAHEAGKDQMAHDIGGMIRGMIDGGAADTDILDAVRSAVIGRLELGLPELPEEFR